MADVVVFGDRDFAELAVFYLEQDAGHRVVALSVEGEFLDRSTLAGRPVIPFEELAASHPPDAAEMLVAIGPSRVNRLRARIYGAAKSRGYRLLSYVSSRASVWPETRLGDNCFLFEDTVVEPFAELGNDNILWSGARVCHHSRVGDHCFFAPSARISGRVEVGDYSFLGIGATVRDYVKLGEGSVVGAGALIKKDTEPGAVYSQPGTPIYLHDSSDVRL